MCLEDDIFTFRISLKNMPIINVLRYDVLLTVMNELPASEANVMHPKPEVF